MKERVGLVFNVTSKHFSGQKETPKTAKGMTSFHRMTCQYAEPEARNMGFRKRLFV